MKPQRHVSVYYFSDGSNEVSISIDDTETDRRYKNVSHGTLHRLTNILWMDTKVNGQYVHLSKHPSIWFWYGDDPRTPEQQEQDILSKEWKETYQSLG